MMSRFTLDVMAYPQEDCKVGYSQEIFNKRPNTPFFLHFLVLELELSPETEFETLTSITSTPPVQIHSECHHIDVHYPGQTSATVVRRREEYTPDDSDVTVSYRLLNLSENTGYF